MQKYTITWTIDLDKLSKQIVDAIASITDFESQAESAKVET